MLNKQVYSGKFNIKTLLQRGFWAVADQGLFALSNFIINVFLARWLSLQDYGAFASTFSVFLFFGTIHTALLTEPLLIYGAGKYKHCYEDYFINLFYGHILFSFFGFVLLLITTIILHLTGHQLFAHAFLGLSIAQPFILLAWLVRRVCYTKFAPRIAAVAGFAYLFFSVSGCFMLYRINCLSPFTALTLMGIASFVAAVWMMLILFPLRSFLNIRKIDTDMWKTHMKYSRWSLPSSGLTWIPANVYYIALPFLGYVELVGILRAQYNLLMPILQINTALATQIIPTLVQQKGTTSYNKFIRVLLAFFIITALVYWGGLNIFRDLIIQKLYGKNYMANSDMLLILGILPLFTGIIAVFGGNIRANDQPQQIFWAYLFASVFTITVGIWMMAVWGFAGVALAIVIAYSVVMAVMLYFFFGEYRKQTTK